MIEFFVKISLKKIKMETKNKKFFVEEANCKLMVVVVQKSKQTSLQQMTSKILKRLLQGIKVGSYLPKYPTKSQQIILQLRLLEKLLGLIFVIQNVDGTDGYQDAQNIVIKLFLVIQELKNVSKKIPNALVGKIAPTINVNVVLKVIGVNQAHQQVTTVITCNILGRNMLICLNQQIILIVYVCENRKNRIVSYT